MLQRAANARCNGRLRVGRGVKPNAELLAGAAGASLANHGQRRTDGARHLLDARLPSYVGARAPILGEFSTYRAVARPPFQPDPVLRPWPELGGGDCASQHASVLLRLWRLNDKGYDLGLLWPDIDKDQEPHRPGREKYSPAVWRAVDDFFAGRRA